MFWLMPSESEALAIAWASVLVAVALDRMVVVPLLVSDAASLVAPPSTPATSCSIVPDGTATTAAVAAGLPVLVTPVTRGASPGMVATCGRLRPGTVVLDTWAIAGMVRHNTAVEAPKTRAARFEQAAIMTYSPADDPGG